MPHLQFELNRRLVDADKIAVAENVRHKFSSIMDLSTVLCK